MKNLKQIPKFKSDAEAEQFVEKSDLSEYDLSGFKPMSFEVKRKEASLNMRLPAELMDAVRAKARAQGIPYARYVRMVLENDLRQGKKTYN